LDVDALVPVDRVFQRDRLGVLDVGRFALGQSDVIGVGSFLGALLGARPAADAFLQVDVAGMLRELDGEVPRRARDVLDFGERSQLDVQVPADLDQFR
jgi:hypothetical protein